MKTFSDQAKRLWPKKFSLTSETFAKVKILGICEYWKSAVARVELHGLWQTCLVRFMPWTLVER